MILSFSTGYVESSTLCSVSWIAEPSLNIGITAVTVGLVVVAGLVPVLAAHQAQDNAGDVAVDEHHHGE